MANLRQYNTFSRVEEIALKKSHRKFIYPQENIKSIVVENFPMLGKLTALRFLEWVQLNPGGVIALPTGKTPEYFIKWTGYYLKNWDKKQVQKELKEWGINIEQKPKMDSLYFVQIDEFYPIDPKYQNSFYYYVHHFYIKGFGLDEKKGMFIDTWKLGVPDGMHAENIFPQWKIDLDLRTRHPVKNTEGLQQKVIRTVDQFTMEYEKKIRGLGGIGFFLGGIGPDGHIAFNVKGSNHNSVTRLTSINYETAAASAIDSGGIEISKNRLVITIGLATITYNPTTTAIIIAAGHSKAKVVRDAIQNKPHILYPATVLQKLPASRFFITKGASSLLVDRCYEDLLSLKKIPQREIEKHTINLAVRCKKKLADLTTDDLCKDRFAQVCLKKSKENVSNITERINKAIMKKLNNGTKKILNTTFLHTAPHPDDIMLGYLPYIVHLVRPPENTHYFAYMTDGFRAVTNSYALETLKNLEKFIDTPAFQQLASEGYFEPSDQLARDRDIYRYLDGIAANDTDMKEEARARRFLCNMIEVYEDDNIDNLKFRIVELKNYFQTQYPGKKDIAIVQRLKGMIREWEVELLWGYLGFNHKNVIHMRLGFYKGDIFTEEPQIGRDVTPLVNLLRKTKPDVITVALDPEASGPDTHYKVLQAISEALKIYQGESKKNIEVWGYRNVWYRFSPSEADIFIPVSMNSFAILHNAFINCFGSQRAASFPSYEYDGPFSELAQKVMVEQYKVIQTCLGSDFFYYNPIPRLRATRGMVYIKEFTLEEFYRWSRELRKLIEEGNELIAFSH
jgi:glucosamine-6-phosphate deaminase